MPFSAVHIPCSVSVCCNLEWFETPVCFVSKGNALEMIENKVGYLESFAMAAYGILRPKKNNLILIGWTKTMENGAKN